MFILVDRETNVVLVTAEFAELVENGISVGDSVFAPTCNLELYEVAQLPADYVTRKYCYIATIGFFLNDQYVAPPLTLEELTLANQELIKQISEQNQQFSDFMDYYFASNPGV